MSLNPYKIVEGKFPKYEDLRDWSEDRWLSFIGFLDFFIKSYDNSEKWHCSSDKIAEFEVIADDQHPWNEFKWRMGQWKEKTTPQKFRLKINGMAMHCLGYLKKHPALVSPKIKEAIEHHPIRLGWVLKQYKVAETLGGDEIVRRDTEVTNPGGKSQMSMPSLNAKLLTSLTKVADIVEILAGSVTASELKGMETKDKLNQLGKLLPILTTLGKAKMAPTHFTQINLSGSTKDIEKQMLDYIKTKD